MRFLPVLILLFAFASRVYGTACTSALAGPWSAQTTWGSAGTGCSGAVGGIPGNTDTVTIRHAVTVDVNTTVGDSPIASKTNPGAVLIQYTNGTTQMGTLAVDPAITFTVRGDIRLDSGTTASGYKARFSMGTGSILQFDSSAATATYEDDPIYRIYSVDSAGSTSEVWATGTALDPFIYRSVTTSRNSNDYHQFVDQNSDRIDVRLTYGTLEDCGSLKAGAVRGCVAHQTLANGTDRIEMRHITMNRTSGIKGVAPANQSPAHANAYFVLDDVKTFATFTDAISGTITDPRDRRSLFIQANVAVTTGTLQIINCYFDQGANFYGAAGFLVSNNVFDGYSPSHNAASVAQDMWWSSLSAKNVFRRRDTASGSGQISALGPITDMYYYMDTKTSAAGNPHGLTMGLTADATFQGYIFDYANVSSNDPNGLYAAAYPVSGGPWTYTYTFKNNLFLPTSNNVAGAYTSTRTSSIIHNWYVGTPPGLIFHHNTAMAHGGFAGSNYVDESVNYAPAGSIDQYKSNLIYALSTTTYSWMYGLTKNLSVANAVDPTGTDYNSCFNCAVLSGTAWTAATAATACAGDICTNNSTTYNVPMTGTVPGTHDLAVSADPGFVDIRRNLKTWCDEVTAQTRGTCTGDDAFNYLATGPGTMEARITALLVWVRDGFRPTNEAFRSAGHDGADIGAVPMTAAAGTPTIITQPVRHWTNITYPERTESVWIAPYADGSETFCAGCTAFSQAYILDAITRGHEAGMNTVDIYTRLNGYALYRVGNVDPVHPDIAVGFDPLRFAIDTAHAMKPPMKVKAHTYVTPMGNGCGSPSFPGGHIWTQHGQSATGSNRWQTESAVSERQGGEQSGCSYGLYADPGHPEFFAYITNQIDAMFEAYPDLDGGDLDYARLPYPVGGNIADTYGFNDGAVARHQRRTSTAIRPTSTDAAFTTSRQRDIEFLVRNVSARAKERNSHFLMGAAVKADHTLPTGAGICSAGFYTICNTYHQKWDDWISHGWLDKAHPMIYKLESDGASVTYLNAWLTWAQTYWPTKVDPGLAGYLNTAAGTLAQVSRANAAGLGYVLFRHNYATSASPPGSVPSNVLYNALGSRAPYPARAPRPDRSTGLFLGDVSVGTGIAELKDGLTVEILNVSATVVHTTWTDATGFWAAMLSPGTYSVRLKALDGTTLYTSPAAIISAGHSYRQNASVSE